MPTIDVNDAILYCERTGHGLAGLWSIVDEGCKDRYRANADIGFTDVRSASLDVTVADPAVVTTPALVLAGARSPSLRSIVHRAGSGATGRPPRRARRLRRRHLPGAARRLRIRRLDVRRRGQSSNDSAGSVR